MDPSIAPEGLCYGFAGAALSADGSDPRDRGEHGTQGVVVTFCLALVGLACCLLYLYRDGSFSGGGGFPLDDSWIHLHFARNLAEGKGLSFRGDRLVAGSTAPLWTALLSLVFWLPGPAIVWAKASGVALYLVGAGLTVALARALGVRRGPAWLAGLLFLLTDMLVWAALSGMEIHLFVTASLAGCLLHLRERGAPAGSTPALSLVVFAAAALARPEGLLLLVLALFDRLVLVPSDRRAPSPGFWTGLVCALTLLLASQLFSALATGSVLPTTYSVKTGGIQSLLPSARFVLRVVGILFRSQPVPVLLAGGGALVLVSRLGTVRDRGLLPALWPIGLPLAYSLFDSPTHPMLVGNFGRYYFPLFPFVLVLAVLAIDAMPRPELAAGLRAAGVVLALVALIGPAARTTWLGARQYAQNVGNVNQSDVAMARWIDGHLAADALVAAQDIGAIGYFAPNPLVDLAGIVNPEILPWIKGAEASRAGSPQEGLVAFLRQRRPSYLMIFRESYPGLVDRLEATVVRRLAVDRNITMAGSELLLLEVDWNRSQPR